MPRTTVLVTGATGFIAGHCIEELLRHGYTVRGTVRNKATANLAHLKAIAQSTGGELELTQATLDDDTGWAEAAKGCDYIWHLASPVPARLPRNEAELIRPAVDGTLRVLRAAVRSSTVQRVVMTSSTDAIVHGHTEPGRISTEADWSDPEKLAPYPKSKMNAERVAWDFAATHPVDLVTINPGLVLGPLHRKQQATSMEVIRLLLARKLPAVPKLSFAPVDVRDIAAAHRLAMETPAAAGHRYIYANPAMWMGDIAAVLATAFGPDGYRVPTRPLPYWLMWANARFDKTIRLALSYYGVPVLVSADKAKQDLGWIPRPASESIVAAGESLIRHGLVPRRPGPRGQQLLAGAARPELDPGHDGDGHQQPRGEQDVQDGQGDDDGQDQGDDGGHDDRSPMMRGGCFLDSSLPPAAASVDRDQPRIAPWSAPQGPQGCP